MRAIPCFLPPAKRGRSPGPIGRRSGDHRKPGIRYIFMIFSFATLLLRLRRGQQIGLGGTAARAPIRTAQRNGHVIIRIGEPTAQVDGKES